MWSTNIVYKALMAWAHDGRRFGIHMYPFVGIWNANSFTVNQDDFAERSTSMFFLGKIMRTK